MHIYMHLFLCKKKTLFLKHNNQTWHWYCEAIFWNGVYRVLEKSSSYMPTTIHATYRKYFRIIPAPRCEQLHISLTQSASLWHRLVSKTALSKRHSFAGAALRNATPTIHRAYLSSSSSSSPPNTLHPTIIPHLAPVPLIDTSILHLCAGTALSWYPAR